MDEFAYVTKSNKQIILRPFDSLQKLKNYLAINVANEEKPNVYMYGVDFTTTRMSTSWDLHFYPSDGICSNVLYDQDFSTLEDYLKVCPNESKWSYEHFQKEYEFANSPKAKAQMHFIDEKTRLNCIRQYFNTDEDFEKATAGKLDIRNYKLRITYKYFDIDGFVNAYIISKVINTVDADEIAYSCDGYSSVYFYFKGCTKSKMEKLFKSILTEFENEFSTTATYETTRTASVKYVPSEEAKAKDRYDNEINIGDLVISPQGGYDSGSWVDPFIVTRIVSDRLYTESQGSWRHYYLSERCILLRSKSGVKPKYGKFDWEK